MLKKYAKIYFVFLLCIFLHAPASAQNTKYCDSLIQAGKDATRDKDFLKSLELLSTARTMAEERQWHLQNFWATNYIGNNYIAMSEYGEALNYCLQAYTLAIRELGAEYEMIMLNNIATLYTADKNYEKAKEYYQKAVTTARDNNYKSLGIYLINLGNIENILNHPSQSRIHATAALPELKKHWPKSVVVAKMIIAESDLLSGKNDLARSQALELLKQHEDVTHNDIEVPLKEIIIKSYINEKDYSRAEAETKAILNSKPNLEIKKRAYELLAEIYKKDRSFERALMCKDSIMAMEYTLNEVKNERMFENNKVKFEIVDYKNQLALNEEKLAAERKLFYIIVAVLIIVVFVVVFIFRQKKIIAENKLKITALELDKEKNDNLLLDKEIREKETRALLEQERLKNEIESRNRKLSAKALHISGRNELIEDIVSSLSRNPKLMKDESLANHLKSLKTHLRANDEWDSFINHFEEVNQGFLLRLKALHTSLTANDIRFIAYIYMNLSTKEIASMLNITDDACRKRYERLKLKMDVSKNVTLYSYLSVI